MLSFNSIRKGKKKVSSKFGVHKFLVFSRFQLAITCLLFLNITDRLSMVKSLYFRLEIYKLQLLSSLFLIILKLSCTIPLLSSSSSLLISDIYLKECQFKVYAYIFFSYSEKRVYFQLSKHKSDKS
jgi:hypothetical protein